MSFSEEETTEEKAWAILFLTQLRAPYIVLSGYPSIEFVCEKVIDEFWRKHDYRNTSRFIFGTAASYIDKLREKKQLQFEFQEPHCIVLFYRIYDDQEGMIKPVPIMGEQDENGQLLDYAHYCNAFICIEVKNFELSCIFRTKKELWNTKNASTKRILELLFRWIPLNDRLLTDIEIEKHLAIQSGIQAGINQKGSTSTSPTFKVPNVALIRCSKPLMSKYDALINTSLGSSVPKSNYKVMRIDYGTTSKALTMANINDLGQKEEWDKTQLVLYPRTLNKTKRDNLVQIITGLNSRGHRVPTIEPRYTFEVEITKGMPQVQKIRLLTSLIPGPLDVLIQSVMTLYDVAEAAYKIAKAIKPYFIASTKEGSGGLISIIKSQARSVILEKEIRKWRTEFKEQIKNKPDLSKKQIDDMETAFLEQKLREVIEKRLSKKDDPNRIPKAIATIRRYSVDELKLLGKEVLLDLFSIDVLSSMQKKLALARGIITQSELSSYKPNVDGFDTDLMKKFKAGKSKQTKRSKGKEDYVDSTDIDYTTDKGDDYWNVVPGQAPQMAKVGVGVGVEIGETQLIGCADACIGEAALVFGIACLAVMAFLTGVSASAVIGGAFLSKTLPYIYSRWSKGAGGFGDTVRDKGRKLRDKVKEGFLVKIQGKSKKEAQEIIASDLVKRSEKMEPLRAMYIIQTMTEEQLAALPKHFLETFVTNNVLTDQQVALLIKRGESKGGISKSLIVGTVYDTSYVKYLQNLSRAQLKAIRPENLKLFMKARILTLPQVKFLLDEKIINKGDLRGTIYASQDFTKVDAVKKTIDAPKYNTDFGRLTISIQQSLISKDQLKKLSKEQIQFFVNAHAFTDSQIKLLVNGGKLKAKDLERSSYKIASIESAPEYTVANNNADLEKLISGLGGKLPKM